MAESDYRALYREMRPAELRLLRRAFALDLMARADRTFVRERIAAIDAELDARANRERDEIREHE